MHTVMTKYIIIVVTLKGIILFQVYDECALSQLVKDEMYKCYPDAPRAHLKSGGNFPYLSRADEVNVHLQVPMKCYRYILLELCF